MSQHLPTWEAPLWCPWFSMTPINRTGYYRAPRYHLTSGPPLDVTCRYFIQLLDLLTLLKDYRCGTSDLSIPYRPVFLVRYRHLLLYCVSRSILPRQWYGINTSSKDGERIHVFSPRDHVGVLLRCSHSYPSAHFLARTKCGAVDSTLVSFFQTREGPVWCTYVPTPSSLPHRFHTDPNDIPALIVCRDLSTESKRSTSCPPGAALRRWKDLLHDHPPLTDRITSRPSAFLATRLPKVCLIVLLASL